MHFILLTESDTAANAANNVTNTVNAVDFIKANTFKKYFEELMPKALNMGIRMVIAIVLFIVGLQLIKLIRKVVKKAMSKAKADVGVKQFVDSFINAALFVLLILMIAIECGIDAASIVAIIGSAGVAISLAVQGSLSNLVGGILILLLKPFNVGDYIEDAGSGKQGTVTQIKIFHTTLRTFDNQIIILPNGNLANNVITNVTKEAERRLDISVGISYNSDIDKAKDVLRDMLKEDVAVLKDKEFDVFVESLGESSVNLDIRFWVKKEDYWTAKFRITENTKKTLDKNGVTIPFPQLDVHLDK
jgi:small conductance mechanosensitive channel